jgi:hypothetical protein
VHLHRRQPYQWLLKTVPKFPGCRSHQLTICDDSAGKFRDIAAS